MLLFFLFLFRRDFKATLLRLVSFVFDRETYCQIKDFHKLHEVRRNRRVGGGGGGGGGGGRRC